MTELIGDPGWYLEADELASVYAGHEIASHTVNHPHLTRLESDEVRLEVTRDTEVLEGVSGAPVESLAYPFGDVDDRVVSALETTPITNARTVESTGGFDLPDDLMRWGPTAHHSQALGLVDEFLTQDSTRPALFFIWGHSWEFDGGTPDNSWGLAEEMCRKLGGRSDVWYVGAGEFARYVGAVKSVVKNDGEWVNPSRVSVWIREGEGFRELAPSAQ